MDSKTSFSTAAVPHIPQSPDRHRPLIDQRRNEWQNSPKYCETLNSKPNSSEPDLWLDYLSIAIERAWAIIKAPKILRLVVLAFVSVVISIFFWRNFLSVFIAENQAAWETINVESESSRGDIFGSNRHVHFPGMTHIGVMSADFLPQNHKSKPGNAGKSRRLIFIGDIHGCMAELEALLSKVKYQPEKDHIITAGDMINKGPNSLEVVDFLMSQGASCVRGNHEDRILLFARELAATGLKSQSANEDLTEETEGTKKHRVERELAKSLTSKQLNWLNACPVILRVGELGTHGEIVVVHGGLVPGIRLEDQDPTSVMNMRIIDLTTQVPSEKASQEGSVPWADLWNKHQKLMPAQNPISGDKHSSHNFKHTTVVYGHDAKRGLQIDTYTKGLDSRCVKGEKLTAWVVGDNGKDEIVQVKSKTRAD